MVRHGFRPSAVVFLDQVRKLLQGYLDEDGADSEIFAARLFSFQIPFCILLSGSPSQGSLKDLHVANLKNGGFHQNKGKPPFTSCNVQVYNVRIPA